ncbi:MAG: leucyl/phenylalanyl-tRNA--protein transferase [Leptospiraceae bacterium]|nr:leucyl/phenylalanyl-tRNA--protein transferase [Leptospiraceae bacterium]MDW8306603.1 leucyl/phenylalanyl-tRNA--protein transferase [Leptospiraceae bacterium]
MKKDTKKPSFEDLYEKFLETQNLLEFIGGCRNLCLRLFPRPSEILPSDFWPVAKGGSYRSEELIAAYSLGLFPWGDDPLICWYFPKVRAIFPLDRDLHIGRTLRKILRKRDFVIVADHNFPKVIHYCRELRKGKTWISEALIRGYIRLHQQGFAHSIEVYRAENLVAGIYGVSLGAAFFAESMFHLESNMSKIALIALHHFLRKQEFCLFDIQTMERPSYKEALGAIAITPGEYVSLLEASFQRKGIYGSWQNIFTFP